MMGVDCKRQIIRALQPLLGATDKVFQVPGSELILVLDGPDPAARLNHMVAILNHKISAGIISRWILSLARHEP